MTDDLVTRLEALHRRTLDPTIRETIVALAEQAEAVLMSNCYKNERDAMRATLTAAVREARAETWEKAADEICNNRENGGVLYEVVERMRNRAAASRAADPTGDRS